MICFLMQISIVGWMPATIWAIVSVSDYYSDKPIDRLQGVGEAVKTARPAPQILPDRAVEGRAVRLPPGPTVENYLSSKTPPHASSRFGASAVSAAAESQRLYDDRKWRALVTFDDEIAEAATLLRVFGAQWEDELARSYLLLNNKGYLAVLVDKLIKDALAQRV